MKNYSLLFLALFTSFVVRAETFKAGAALRVITPDPLLPVSGGVGTPNPVMEKKGDLYARALVFEKGDTRLAIVSIDNLGWPAALGDKSRAQIKGIPPENILIGVTHTHSAPDAYGFPDQNGQHHADLEYLDWCTTQIADAVNEAIDHLQPAVIKINVDKIGRGIAYNAYAEALFDPRCGIIQAIASDGPQKDKPLATLINYASHPEVIGSERGILSPDFCGPLYDRIEGSGGGMAIYMNGAQGGMVTADNRRPDGTEVTTWDECIRIGQLLADEALRLAETAQVFENPELACYAKTIQFPIDSPMMRFIFENSPLNYNMNNGYNVETRVNLVTLGPAQIVTIPGEALPNIGSYLKRKMKTAYPFLFGLTNDAFGYIIAQVDYYAFDRYNYISRTCLGEKTGEIYMHAAENMLREHPGAE